MVQLICGIRRFDGADASPEDLQAMLDAMAPAGKGVAQARVLRGGIALGILHVSPTADAPAVPPWILDRNGCLLAADLRLYPRGRESAATCEAPLEHLHDTFTGRGAEGIADLHGDFAFACYEEATGVLTLARDHFGVRPLQYTMGPGFVAFASLPAALLRTGLAPRALDEEVIEAYPATTMCAPPDRTYFRDVARVPQAHTVTFSAGGLKTARRYWRIAIEKRLPATLEPAVAERELARLLVQAVRRRLPATGDVAAHLSGGLDSSAIAAVAARLVRDAGRSLHGYSYQEARDLPGLPEVHEGIYAVEAAEAEPNIQLHPFGTAGTVRNILDAIDPETMLIVAPGDAEQRVLRDVSSRGMDLLLSGWGGDQIVTSYGTAAESELFITGEWRLLARQLRALRQKTGDSLPKLFLDRVLKRCLPEAVRALRRRQPLGQNFLAPGRRPRLSEKAKVFASARRHRRQKMERWWQPHRLEMLAQLGAPHGVAYTFPMLDLDLIRYGMRLPGIFFNRDGVSRSVFRDAMKGIVPDRVRLRMDKTSPYFLNPYRDALIKDEAAETAQELSKHPTVSSFLDMKKVEGYIRAGPSAEEVLAELRRSDVEKLTLDFYHEQHLTPLALAIFLKAQDEFAESSVPRGG